MYQTLRAALATLLVLAATATASAQVFQVNLASLADLNVTLDDNCQDSLIIEQVLKGDFDADDDGVDAPFDLFTLVVEDGDPTNGPVVDGCGDYLYRVTALDGITGFTVAWGRLSAEDKTPPEITGLPTAPAAPLFCDALEDIRLDNLSSTISRCYTVQGQSGLVMMNTLDSRLAARLTAGGGFPAAFDNCSAEVEICVNDVVVRDPLNPQCGDATLLRTFTATDGSCGSAEPSEQNAAAVATYSITFVNPTLDDLDTSGVRSVVTFDCQARETAGLVAGAVPDPRGADLPFFTRGDGTRVPLRVGNNTFCNIGLTFEDATPVQTCPSTWKVVRTYTVIDWCNPEDVRTYTQLVKVGDFDAPVLTAPTQDLDFDGVADSGPLVFPTNAGNVCAAYLRLDLPGIALTDACSQNLTLSAVVFPGGDLDATPLGTFPVNIFDNTPDVTNLPIPAGAHVLRYTYRDECGNEDFTDLDILIEDRTAPVAICEDGLNISITAGQAPTTAGSTGIAILNPEDIDGGSYDDCSGITRLISFVDANNNPIRGGYSDHLVLTCDDLGTVSVGLRVTDAGGNVNDCWLDVLVEDKSRPRCIVPGAVTVNCFEFSRMFPNDITTATDSELDGAFGVARGIDNCSVTVEQSISGSLTNCGDGSFVRTFTITDGQGFVAPTCVQRITVQQVHNYYVGFPGDEALLCRQVDEQEDLLVTELGCDLIATNVRVDTFATESDECYKLRLTYSVINWCEYDGEGDPYLIPRDFDGDNDNTELTYLLVEPFALSDLGDDVAYLDTDTNFANGSPRRVLDPAGSNRGETTAAYGSDPSRGNFEYIQYVRVYDEVAPTVTVTDPADCFDAVSANCVADVSLDFAADDACTARAELSATAELDADFTAPFTRTRFLTAAELTPNGDGTFTVNLRNVPIGNHAVRIRISDGCGNVAVRIVEFCVRDNKAPTPICIPQLTVTLMPDGNGGGSAAIWATDYVPSPLEDCSGAVTLSIYTIDEYDAPNFVPQPNRAGILLNCESAQTTQVRVYAFDPAGRNSFCNAFTLVQGAETVCDPDDIGSIAGQIVSEHGDRVPDVSVELTTREGTVEVATGDDGRFAFTGLEEGYDYTIDPSLTSYGGHGQGISTYDLVLLTRHILGVAAIPSDYALLAGDANGDREISVQDIIVIRRLILGLDLAYRHSPPYRFVPASFRFPVSGNPWATVYPEVVNVNNLFGAIRTADFVAIMVGDVSGNGLAELTAGTRGRAADRATVALSIDDRRLVAGRRYEVPVYAAGAADLAGLQGELALSADVSLEAVLPGRVAAGSLNDRLLAENRLPFSYAAAAPLATDDVLLTLRVTAHRDVRLADVIDFTDRGLAAEGYRTNDDATVDLRVDFRSGASVTGAATAEDRLYQNAPNPVGATTRIRFDLAEAAPVELTVSDLAGRVILQRRLAGAAGANVVELGREQLTTTGVLTYTVTSGNFTASRKMIVR